MSKQNKTIISPKIDKLVVEVVEDEEDDLFEETINVILEEDSSTE